MRERTRDTERKKTDNGCREEAARKRDGKANEKAILGKGKKARGADREGKKTQEAVKEKRVE